MRRQPWLAVAAVWFDPSVPVSSPFTLVPSLLPTLWRPTATAFVMEATAGPSGAVRLTRSPRAEAADR